MAAGEETPDSGQIIRQNNLKMAYLPQTPEFPVQPVPPAVCSH